MLHYNFHSHFELKIEVREDGAEFLEYNENWIYIRAWTWEMFKDLKRAEEGLDLSGQTEESKEALDTVSINIFELEQSKCDTIRIDSKLDTVEILEQKISEHTGIPVEKLIIMLRNEPILAGGEVLCEHYNMDWARKKKLCDMRSKLTNGIIVYVEEGDQKDNMYYN